jgi:hypothetical protein
MDYTKDIQTLHQSTRFGQILVGGIGIFWSLYTFIACLQVPNDHSIADANERRLVYFILAVVFASVTVFCCLLMRRDSKRLLWVWQNTMPETMMLSIVVKDVESGPSDYGILRARISLKDNWSVPLGTNGWNKVNFRAVQEEAIPAKVYFDPKSRKPAVIETKYGLLWRLRDRAVKRL